MVDFTYPEIMLGNKSLNLVCPEHAWVWRNGADRIFCTAECVPSVLGLAARMLKIGDCSSVCPERAWVGGERPCKIKSQKGVSRVCLGWRYLSDDSYKQFCVSRACLGRRRL